LCLAAAIALLLVWLSSLLPAGKIIVILSSFGFRMKIGDTMDFRGPVTTLNYEPNAARCLGMVAGGTGITPMYQIIRTVLSNPVRIPPTIPPTTESTTCVALDHDSH
jgi:NAD(P)H-flavin reductase